MAPRSRLILATLGLALAGCTVTPPAPTTAPATPTPTASALAAAPTDAAAALAAQPAAHRREALHIADAERIWLRRGENTIDAGGSYLLRGQVRGSVVVDAGDEPVVLLLDGLTLRSSEGPAIDIKSAGQVVVAAVEATTNSIEVDSDSPGIRSVADLTLTGTGSLDIDTAGDGIRVSTGLVIEDGSLRVNAGGDGLQATEYIVVEDGTFTVAADGTGLLVEGDDAATPGYLALRDPFLTISAGGDGLRAAGDLIILGGGLDVRTGGGRQSSVGADDSASALKAGRHLVADGGSVLLDAAADGLNAADTVVLNGGDWEIAAGDDAVHGDLRLTITGGNFEITHATEGLEAETVNLSGGSISVAASDDALNASEADDPQVPPSITISGGTIRLDSTAGDGLDANGDVTMTGGELLITGAAADNESAIDYDGSFLISGGRLAAGGGSGMAQPPSAGSGQRSLWFDVKGRSGSTVVFTGPDGVAVGSFTGTRGFGTVVVSSPAIKPATSYTVTLDGKPVGTTTTQDADTAPRRFPGRR